MDMNEKAAANGMSLAALVFGILSVLGSCTILLPVFTAPMAITFAWLSRGNKRMSTQAFAGNILAIVGICISLIVSVVLISVIITGIAGIGTGIIGPILEDIFHYWG